MEHNQQENKNEMSQVSLSVSAQTLGFLDEIRKWTKFFSILGFVCIGFMVIAAVFMGTALSFFHMPGLGPGSGSIFISILYLALAALYAMPVVYLNNFSNKLKSALALSDSADLESAFENLKSHYKFVGIMTIIMMALYLVTIIFVITGSILALF